MADTLTGQFNRCSHRWTVSELPPRDVDAYLRAIANGTCPSCGSPA